MLCNLSPLSLCFCMALTFCLLCKLLHSSFYSQIQITLAMLDQSQSNLKFLIIWIWFTFILLVTDVHPVAREPLLFFLQQF